MPQFCSNYNYQQGICLTCSQNYILLSKRCYPSIQFCQQYTSLGTCQQCSSGYTPTTNGLQCTSTQVPGCFAPNSNSCDRCMYRFFENGTQCTEYVKYCINIDPLGQCISCCFGSSLINGTCVRDQNIKYCARQTGGQCQQCQSGYTYCAFCESCLPVSPNCRSYNSNGMCTICEDNFVLRNGVCVSQPVGIVMGTTSTCRSGYYLNNGNCYRNANDLRLFSTTVS